ncbi:hypothetical protein Fmac_026787 [Flemingia macrophylla]|uniref:Squalene monooxygenase n=1 Tax=Flemingia macrophylla TaxID=520843 RepID=A0ABD1LFU2_9FABA
MSIRCCSAMLYPPSVNCSGKTAITSGCHSASKFSYNKPHTPLLFSTHLPIASPLLKTTTALRRNTTRLPPLRFSGAADVIIVGAGVVGSALTYALAKDGRRVHVIEKDLREPDRIVGEVLLPGGYLKLIELGLEDCLEEIDAQRMIGYVLYKDEKKTKLHYPLEKFSYDVAGRSFHNGRFVQRMREKTSTLENVRMEQGTVTTLLKQDNKTVITVIGVQYKTKDGQEHKAYAPLTVVCDGCFSNLRQSLCRPKVEVPSCFVGLVLENCQLPFENYAHIILADLSIIILYRISSTKVRCLVDIPGQKVPLPGMANYLKTIVTSQIPYELHDAFISAIDRGNIRIMPNSSMPADPYPTTPGALLLGDAFNMRHPWAGGGMTVALSDIVVLQDLLKPIRDLSDSTSLCRHLESFYILRKPMASTINTLADALYKVFSVSPDEARKQLRQATFDYLSLGRFFSSGYMSLFSGLNPFPLSLVLHFSATVFYGVGRLLLPFPSFKRLRIGARLVSCALGIILPVIKAEGVRQMFFAASIPSFYKDPPGR